MARASRPRHPQRRWAIAAALVLCAGARAARADDAQPKPVRAVDPERVSGVARPASEPGDAWSSVAAGLLYIPRETAELVFFATGAAAGLLEDRQVVPRVRELVSPPEGEIGLFPTAFVETGHSFNVGARMIASTGAVATTVRAGYGGTDEVALESRVRVTGTRPLPTALSLEALYDQSTDLEFLGVGQSPESDARNAFVGPPRTGLYRERKVRGLVSFGVRPTEDLELLPSLSLTRRRVDDAPDSGSAGIGRVFAPGTVVGVSGETHVLYGELAFRLDTRKTRGAPSPGAVVEGYAGAAQGFGGGVAPDAHLVRVGGRVAAFLPIVRRSNILSPKITVDHLVAPSGGPVPFTELTGEPEFRGEDTRRDYASVVVSLDYRYAIMRYIAGRLFVDSTAVAPDPSAVDFSAPRFAWGLGVDFASLDATIGQVAVAFSPESVRLLVTLGVPAEFGDRQHRD